MTWHRCQLVFAEKFTWKDGIRPKICENVSRYWLTFSFWKIFKCGGKVWNSDVGRYPCIHFSKHLNWGCRISLKTLPVWEDIVSCRLIFPMGMTKGLCNLQARPVMQRQRSLFHVQEDNSDVTWSWNSPARQYRQVYLMRHKIKGEIICILALLTIPKRIKIMRESSQKNFMQRNTARSN